MRIYKRKIYWALSVFAIFMVLAQAGMAFVGPLAFHPLMLIGVLPSILIFSWQIRTSFIRLEISPSSIKRKSLLGTRELRFENVRGYESVYSEIARYNPLRYIRFHSRTGDSFRVYISRFHDGQSILQWAQANFVDLDTINEKIERQQLEAELSDIPDTKKRAAKLFSAGAFVVSILLLPLLWAPYQQIIILFIIPLPLILIIALYWYRGVLIFFERPGQTQLLRGQNAEAKARALANDPTSSLWLPFAFSSFYVCYVAIKTFHTNHLWDAFWPDLTLAVFLSILVLMREKSFSFRFVPKSMFLLVMFSAYVYGSTITLNVVFDRHNFRTYETELVSSSRGKGSHSATLKNWLKGKKYTKITVSKDELHTMKKNKEKVKIRQHHGAFAIPWFEILAPDQVSILRP